MTERIKFDDTGFVTIRINIKAVTIAALSAAIIAPPIYLLAMLRYGAIRSPYWDHINTAREIIAYFDGALTFANLVDTQAQARPLFPRLIFIASAALTHWDVRLEYIYNTLMIFGALAVLLFALWKISQGWSLTVRLVTALLISILACSPVGCMNHYWSLMLIATLPYFLTLAIFVAISLKSRSWPVNIACAALAWVSTYSISQGLFIFPVMIFVHQMIPKNKLIPSGFAIFWLVNMVACYALYLPGVPMSPEHPTILNFLTFIVAYVGNPLGGLIWFPEAGTFSPSTVAINFVCGLAILVLSAWTMLRALREDKTPAVLMFLSLCCYATICALTTAWGRAVGPQAIESANVSRYSIFAACFLFALIFYYSPRFAEREATFTRWHKAALAIFLTLAAFNYYRGVSAYNLANGVNGWVALAYAPEAAPTRYDAQMFPNAAFFRKIKSDLYRLRIGPYRGAPISTDGALRRATQIMPLTSGPFIVAIPLTPGRTITQRFKPAHPSLISLTLPLVTWAQVPSVYSIKWKITALVDGLGQELASGDWSTEGLRDWQQINLALPHVPDVTPHELELEMWIPPDQKATVPAGVPLFRPSAAENSPAAAIDGTPSPQGAVVGIQMLY